MRKIKVTVAAVFLVLVSLALAVATSGLLSDQQKIPNTGVLTSVGIGVFTDPSATINCTSIDWGILSPGDTATTIVFVKNLGNTNETLHAAATDWEPTNASSILTLNFNKEGTTLQESLITQATLTLTVASDVGSVSDFNFNVIISGSA